MTKLTASGASVLDTNRNIASISQTQRNSNSAYKSYLTSLYRCMNLDLAKMLEALVFRIDYSDYVKLNRETKLYMRSELLGIKSIHFSSQLQTSKDLLKEAIRKHPDSYIIRTVMDLRGCSRLASIASDEHGNDYISGTSKKCRNKYCYICNRSRSQKFTSRFVKLVKTQFSDFNKCRFYFLTLTLVHNKNIRTGDYLAELKGYVGKLFRSKMFKQHFKAPKGIEKVGTIRGYENKIGVNGNHIHVHILIMSDRIGKVMDVQNDIKDWWIKKTEKQGHISHQVDLELIGKGLQKDDWSDFLGSVRDVLKYSTKFDDTNFVSNKEVKTLGDWMKSSKGKNFRTATGAFSGYQLTSHKSELDEEYEAQEHQHVKVGITTELKYKTGVTPVRLDHRYSKDDRHLLRDDITLTGGSVTSLNRVYDEFELRDLLNSKTLLDVDMKMKKYDESEQFNLDWMEEAKAQFMKDRGITVDSDGWYTHDRFGDVL